MHATPVVSEEKKAEIIENLQREGFEVNENNDVITKEESARLDDQVSTALSRDASTDSKSSTDSEHEHRGKLINSSTSSLTDRMICY